MLIVDDEPSIRRVLRRYLEADGHRVFEASSGTEALQFFTQPDTAPAIDLVLLDIGLPDIDGLQVLTRIRKSSSTYVMVISARAEESDKIVGLTVGADDYVTKPFSVREVAARIKAVFRRMGTSSVISIGGLRISPDERSVTLNGNDIELSQLDFDVLTLLASQPGRVWSRQQLLEKVWGYDFFGDERVIDVHIRTIRKALGDDVAESIFIATVRGVGYKFLGEQRH